MGAAYQPAIAERIEKCTMTFAGINPTSPSSIAAVVGWLTGAVYTGARQALGRGAGQDHGGIQGEQAALKGASAAWLPFALAFLADLVMAWVLAGMVGHLGAGDDPQRGDLRRCSSGPASCHHHAGQQRLRGPRYVLTAIDAGHWLAVSS